MAYAFTAPPNLGWAVEAAAEMAAGGAVFGFAVDADNNSSGGVLGL